MKTYLYVGPEFDSAGIVSLAALEETTERHRFAIERPFLEPAPDPASRLSDPALSGVVIELPIGWPARTALAIARAALRRNRSAWFYWPAERAVERLSLERLRSYWRLWMAVKAFGVARRAYHRVRGRRTEPAGPVGAAGRIAADRLSESSAIAARPAPAPIAALRSLPASQIRGAYVRTDFWASLTSGGSYGHTSYVAAELSKRCGQFVAFMAHPYALMDRLGVHQVALPAPSATHAEEDLLAATPHYERVLRPALEALRPAFVYERLCLGNFACASLTRALGIPYVVEYNGSELSMRRSFEGRGYAHEDVYAAAETAAFAQAALITVISEPVRDDLAARGVDPDRIVVNPNGADVEAYAPADDSARAAIRRDLGWDRSHTVVGFIGTFGGWHGIDVLAASLAPMCGRHPHVRFLLVGDGPHRSLVDAAVREAGLESRVRLVGRVPQEEGARLLKACDLYVSPHSSHMVDSRFFGSPTKLFEYMALAGGIVASDLEQIGEVLRPALAPASFRAGAPRVDDERAVLCEPGDVDQFLDAMDALIRYPEVARALGRNARRAVLEEFSWSRHVQRIWDCLTGAATPRTASFRRPVHVLAASAGGPSLAPVEAGELELTRIETGDAYKDEVQHQWNHNPVGSQYVRRARKHTLEWFLEVEAHRYGEYAPWMPEVMEFARHAGEQVLEIGAGMGTDLAQFARHGAIVTDVDLSAGHLEHARENFRLRGLEGRFVHHDAESLPFEDGEFDLVYSNGVIHHSPNTRRIVDEIHRVLRPGGRAIVMVYAENSLHYWKTLVGRLGLIDGMLDRWSIGEIMSRHVELTANDARPLVKVYTPARLRALFGRFDRITIDQRQLTAPELPRALRWMPLDAAGRLLGWNLIIKARKPPRA